MIHYSDIINYFCLPVMKLQNAFGQRRLISFRACGVWNNEELQYENTQKRFHLSSRVNYL